MARDGAAVWFVMIDGKRTGPMSRVELGLEAATGTIDGNSFCWRSGMAGWQHGSEIEELASLFAGESAPAKPAKPAPARAAAKPTPARPAAKAAAAKPAPRAAASAPDKKPDPHGKGMMDLDTAHFRLADAQVKSEGDAVKKLSEFDSGFFKLQEVKGSSLDDALKKASDFDSAFFKLSELKKPAAAAAPDESQDWSKLTLQKEVVQHKPGVAGYPDQKKAGPQKPTPLAAAAAKAAAAAPADDWSKLTLQKEVAQHSYGVQGDADQKKASAARGKPAPAKPTPAAAKAIAEAASAPDDDWSRLTTNKEQVVYQHGVSGANEAKKAAPQPASKLAPVAAKSALPGGRAMPVSRPTPAAGAQSARPSRPPARPAQPEAKSGGSTMLIALVGGGALLAIVALWLLFR